MEKKISEKMNSTMEKKISEKMSEIREAAEAYFENMPEEEIQNTRSFFARMDTSDDKKISYAEFSEGYKQLDVSGDQDLDNKLFEELDENGDGYLNFNEFLTLVYILDNKRLMYCDGCQQFLKGLYFTCLPCFNQGQPMDNYCTACYRGGRHSKHSCDETARFIDNYALLLTKAVSTDGAAQPTERELTEVSTPGQLGKRQRIKRGVGYLVGAISSLLGADASGKVTDDVAEPI